MLGWTLIPRRDLERLRARNEELRREVERLRSAVALAARGPDDFEPRLRQTAQYPYRSPATRTGRGAYRPELDRERDLALEVGSRVIDEFRMALQRHGGSIDMEWPRCVDRWSFESPWRIYFAVSLPGSEVAAAVLWQMTLGESPGDCVVLDEDGDQFRFPGERQSLFGAAITRLTRS